jgi:hypothetical protein
MATRTDRVEADFVVVGAGSAGCAVAARLSEDTATRVVLLEAGGEDKNRWIHIPLGFGKTFADPSVNWCYQTEPDPGAADRRVFWPRGKVLGGSSSINGMVYIRGQAEDFDHWRQLGNTGWSFEDVLPYFRRSEHQVRGADAFHGMGGPPAVHPNYLASETDQRTIVAGLKLCRQILENPHLKPFIASEFQPGPAVESDEQLLDYARRRGGTVYHPTSTCKMGGDPLAVVDAELRVHGIGGLRVADASIMPTVVSGNTNAATIMIGEKAADMARQPMRLAAQGLRASEHIPGCLIEKDPPLLFAWRGRATQLFAQIHPSLHRRALLDRVAPAGDVGELVERLAERFGDQHPWPARHIGYRVVVEGEVAVSEAAFEHTETAVVLVGIALAGIRMLTLSVIDEVAELPGHRTEIADLPEQPLQALFAGAPALRHEPPGPLGEMDQDRARLEHRQRPVAKLLWGVVVDNRRHAVIRADRQEFGLELVAATDIYRDHAEVEAALLEHDRDLPAVRGRPIVKVDHVLPPELNSAISAVE